MVLPGVLPAKQTFRTGTFRYPLPMSKLDHSQSRSTMQKTERMPCPENTEKAEAKTRAFKLASSIGLQKTQAAQRRSSYTTKGAENQNAHLQLCQKWRGLRGLEVPWVRGENRIVPGRTRGDRTRHADDDLASARRWRLHGRCCPWCNNCRNLFPASCLFSKERFTKAAR